MTTDEAIELVRRKWDESGGCCSCGWHACLYEYGELADAIEIDYDRQCVSLSCLSDDDEEAWSHRGVRIPFDVTPESADAVREGK